MDRRSGVDRRFGGERRRAHVAVAQERRIGPRRRQTRERRLEQRRAFAPRRRVVDRRTRRAAGLGTAPAD